MTIPSLLSCYPITRAQNPDDPLSPLNSHRNPLNRTSLFLFGFFSGDGGRCGLLSGDTTLLNGDDCLRPPKIPGNTCDRTCCDGVSCDCDCDWDCDLNSEPNESLGGRYSFLRGDPARILMGEPYAPRTGCEAAAMSPQGGSRCDETIDGWLVGTIMGCWLDGSICEEVDSLPPNESRPRMACDRRSAFLRRASRFEIRLSSAASASRSWPGRHVILSGSTPRSQRERLSSSSPLAVSDVLMVAYLRSRRTTVSPCGCSSIESSGVALPLPFHDELVLVGLKRPGCEDSSVGELGNGCELSSLPGGAVHSSGTAEIPMLAKYNSAAMSCKTFSRVADCPLPEDSGNISWSLSNKSSGPKWMIGGRASGTKCRSPVRRWKASRWTSHSQANGKRFHGWWDTAKSSLN